VAKQEGNSPTGRRRTRPLRYFYLNGNLHKSLHINRGADTITTWCYPLHKRVAYTYSDVKKYKGPAFTTQETAKMLMRTRLTLEHAILRGDIEAPQFTYGLNEHKKKFKYMWSEDNVLEAHAYLSTVHRGRPRKDGLITPQRLPTVRELRAMMRNETVFYVQDDDGEFRPVWGAVDFD
jgi:hypothetical protein